MLADVELVLDCRNQHGEGILWDAQARRVRWTDIEGRKLWSFDPVTGEAAAVDVPHRVCCFAPRKAGGLIVALADSIGFSADGASATSFYSFEPANGETRLNDGRTDRQGRLVVGGMNEGSGAANSSVVRVDTDGSVTSIIDGVSCANSICFSPSGTTLFFADTPRRQIMAYPYNPQSGALGEPRLFADLASEPGLPDGSCVDSEGGVWNAQWEGGRVVRFDPDGRLDCVVELPVGKVTCCAFGGENLDTLFITTSRLGSDAEKIAAEPMSGGLFAIKPGFRGLIDTPFAG